MNDQLKTNPFKKLVVVLYPGYTNTFPSGAWLEVWLKIANNTTVKGARTNWCHLQQLLDQESKLVAESQLWCLPAHPALFSLATAPLRVHLVGALRSRRGPQGETHWTCNSHKAELF